MTSDCGGYLGGQYPMGAPSISAEATEVGVSAEIITGQARYNSEMRGSRPVAKPSYTNMAPAIIT